MAQLGELSMKVVSYSRVIPVKNNSIEKQEILKKYIQGVSAAGDTALYHSGYNLIDCDVAVIQGWQHELGKTSPHLILRKKIVDHQIQNKKHVCVADSNLFLYATKNNTPDHYLRYSFNGVFPNTGIYCDTEVDPTRWQQISRDLKIEIADIKNNGKNILICLQRNGGWSMGNINISNWITQTIAEIRKHSDRHIVLRPHPKDSNADQYLKNIVKEKNIKVSLNQSLEKDLEKAWCVVNHNSSSIVGAVIQGHPAFITDPLRSQCSDVADTDFANIENPTEFDRQKWLERISMFHWKFSELENGSCWQHMRSFIN